VIRVLGEQRRIVVSDFGVDDVSARGHTDLALVHERTEGAHRHGLFQINVIHHNERRIST